MLLARPIARDTRRALARAWSRIPARFRTHRQFLGRHYAGCAATIGTMPRCDFACRGCYLGADANRVPARPVEEIKSQLGRIRQWLGEGGNVQLTDGEVTLRPETELIELIREARRLGLVPMVMTHGDSFRRRPGLLERLMVEGGLTEVSIHIDTTQRGRTGADYKHATRECELIPLRDEFAEMVRKARRETGRTLEVASTFTVTRDNLDGVPAVIRWFRGNADAFKMISFQPVADVGRTESGVSKPVSREELWQRIAEGLDDGTDGEALDRQRGWFGHPECSGFVQGLVVDGRFHPLVDMDDPADRRTLVRVFDAFGGLTFRLDGRRRALLRLCGATLRHPWTAVRHVLPWAWRLAGRASGGRRLTLLGARVHYLNLVSHHFMSRQQIETPLGRERIDACAFKVPVDGKMVSMCEVNATGLRDAYYDAGRERRRRTPVTIAAPRMIAARPTIQSPPAV